MRVLITGAGGALGRDLVAAFADHDVVACDHATLDVGDREAWSDVAEDADTLDYQCGTTLTRHSLF